MTQLRKSTRDPLGQKMAYKFAQLHVGQNDGAEGLVDLPEVDLKQKKNEIVNLSHENLIKFHRKLAAAAVAQSAKRLGLRSLERGAQFGK